MMSLPTYPLSRSILRPLHLLRRSVPNTLKSAAVSTIYPLSRLLLLMTLLPTLPPILLPTLRPTPTLLATPMKVEALTLVALSAAVATVRNLSVGLSIAGAPS